VKRAIFVYALILALSAITANAIPTNITVSNTGNLLNGSGVASKAQYGQQNNNPTSNFAFLNKEIGFWNGALNPDLPTANRAAALSVDGIGDTSSYNAVAGYSFVVFHFGNGDAGGSPGGWWHAWYLNGLGGTFIVPAFGGASVGGFSSAHYYSPHVSVPDGGATVMLLGAAFAVIAAARRKFIA
jgi:protein with PEP-CTERM/exosortase system signal